MKCIPLSEQVAEDGFGTPLLDDIPDRPTASTPEEQEKVYGKARAEIMKRLKFIIDQNQSITGYCTHPLSKVTITVRDPTKILHMKQYPVALSLIDPATKILARWYTNSKIELGDPNEPNCMALRMAPRKDEFGQLRNVRLCGDLRPVNDEEISDDKYELPKVSDMIYRLGKKRIFAEIDLSEAYTQFELTKESRRFASFIWLRVRYQFRAAPFGLKQLPSLFQRCMMEMFGDMLDFVEIYIDNIIIASNTVTEHEDQVRRVIERWNRWNLKVKPGSVSVAHYQIKVLGHLLTRQGVGIDPAKIEVLSKWELPQDTADLRAFLGFVGFLSDHIRHFADLAAPLYAHKRKQAQYNGQM